MAFSYHLLIRRGGNGHAYWVVNLVDRVLVVFGEPGDIRYRTTLYARAGRARRAGVVAGFGARYRIGLSKEAAGRGRKRPVWGPPVRASKESPKNYFDILLGLKV